MDISYHYKLLKQWNYLEAQKKLKDKRKSGEKVPIFEVVEVVLVQCNLVENYYQQKFKVFTLLLQINFMFIC